MHAKEALKISNKQLHHLLNEIRRRAAEGGVNLVLEYSISEELENKLKEYEYFVVNHFPEFGNRNMTYCFIDWSGVLPKEREY